MKIEENQIKSVEPFGVMDGKQVNLVRLVGGLNLATMVGKNGTEDVLGAASHQAILCYSIEQRFPSFQPMLMKSEHESFETESHSHFLSDDLRKSGHDLYSVQNGNNVEFYLTKQNIRTNSISSTIIGDLLLTKSEDISKLGQVTGEQWNALCSAVSEKALSAGLKGVRVK